MFTALIPRGQSLASSFRIAHKHAVKNHTSLVNNALVSTSTPDTIKHPIIDVSSLFEEPKKSNNPQQCYQRRAETTSKIGAALKNCGYFYAQNVSVLSPSYLESIYRYSERLHSLPTHVKKQFSYSGHGAYSGIDIGQAELAYDVGTVASVRGWDYSRTKFTLKGDNASDGNCYPDDTVISPSYVEVLDELYERQDVLGRALMMAFAECLGLESDRLVKMFEGGDFGTLRLLYYPGMDSESVEAANVGISAHTDFEAFTLMHQSAPGLQFLPKNAEWVDAPVRPGEFVVIVGDALERVTNGILRATPHRVLKTAHTRRSIIRFNAFSSDTILEPLPEFVSENRPSAYTPVSMEVHMQTTMRNLEKGYGSWDHTKQRSLSSTYVYIDGKDHRL